MSTKEQYWKYSLIVIILFMGIIIFRQITPFLGGLLGALTIYILVRGQMRYLVEKRKLKRSLSALLITAETIFVFLIPLGLTVWMVVNKLQDINLDPQTYIAPIQQVAEFIKEKTGYDVLGKDTLTFIVSILPRIGQIIMESISSLAITQLFPSTHKMPVVDVPHPSYSQPHINHVLLSQLFEPLHFGSADTATLPAAESIDKNFGLHRRD